MRTLRLPVGALLVALMRRKLLPLAIAMVLACITAATGLAAGSTKVNHFLGTFADNVCGFLGRPTSTGRRSSATRTTART